MYTRFFNLHQMPFSIAPDPRYLFMTEGHREALAHLMYGIDGGGGLVLLTGEIGAGKTTVCRCFLEQVPPNCNVAYIFNPKLTVSELLQSICDEFHIRTDIDSPENATIKAYVDALTRYLLATHAEGKNNVLIIDEAQNLTADVLEQLRLLTNLETNERKLLQIILIGQPELRLILDKPELKQLAQRVIARYHLHALSMEETARYIQHRLSIAGLRTALPFPPQTLRQIHQLTHGVPRRINVLCDRALLGAYAEGKQSVDRKIISKAANEVFGNRKGIPRNPVSRRWHPIAVALMLCSLGAGGVALSLNDHLTLQHIGKEFFMETPQLASATSSQGKIIQEIPPSATAEEHPAPIVSKDTTLATASDPSNVPPIGTMNFHDAYRQLAQIWGMTLSEGEPCKTETEAHLHCYRSANGLNELRQLDRPAILILHDNAGRPYYPVLTKLDDTNATLQTGSTSRTVSLIMLGRYFRGNFITFWRTPFPGQGLVGYGDRGKGVDWIAAQLAKLNQEEVPEGNQVFDENMKKQVRSFQVSQGLKADGLIGPVTFMHLTRAAGIKEPRLRSNPEPVQETLMEY